MIPSEYEAGKEKMTTTVALVERGLENTLRVFRLDYEIMPCPLN
jgi:hypothetical protein